MFWQTLLLLGYFVLGELLRLHREVRVLKLHQLLQLLDQAAYLGCSVAARVNMLSPDAFERLLHLLVALGWGLQLTD